MSPYTVKLGRLSSLKCLLPKLAISSCVCMLSWIRLATLHIDNPIPVLQGSNIDFCTKTLTEGLNLLRNSPETASTIPACRRRIRPDPKEVLERCVWHALWLGKSIQCLFIPWMLTLLSVTFGERSSPLDPSFWRVIAEKSHCYKRWAPLFVHQLTMFLETCLCISAK